MTLSLNKVTIAGHLTRDPDAKIIGEGRTVCSFGLALNERYKGKDGEMKESTTFLDVEAWGRTSELVAQYLVKGSACYIEGKLKVDQWDDKDGNKRTKVKVVADSVQFISPPPKKDGSSSDGYPRSSAQKTPTYAPDAQKAKCPAPRTSNDDEPTF